MSYILDALKKLEQRQEQEEQPKLPLFSREPEPGPKKRSWWPYLVAGALLVNAAVMVWWIAPRQGEKGRTSPRPAGQEVEKREDQPPAPLPAERAGQGPRAEKRGGTARRREDLKTGQAARAAPEETPGRKTAEAAEAPFAGTSAADRQEAGPEAPREKTRTASRRVFEVGDLPPAIKGALPEFRVSGHAYSPEPQTRVVRVNEKILQEGQDLAPGLKTEEITPEGIIFSYRGYRFRIAVNVSH
jgi:general secretion pathway protein B